MGLYKNNRQQLSDSRRITGQQTRMRRMLAQGESARIIRIETVSEAERYALANDAEQLNAYHRAIEQWQQTTTDLLKTAIAGKSKSVASSIKSTAHTDRYGVIDGLGFRFARQGIYIHYGAGNGYSGATGSKWTYLRSIAGIKVDSGIVRNTRPSSMAVAKMGSDKRPAYRWFDPVVRSQIEPLADIVAAYFSTTIINDENIYIEK